MGDYPLSMESLVSWGLLWLERDAYLSVTQEARVLQKSTWDIPRGRV